MTSPRDVLPCSSSGARTTGAPNTAPIAWWPRHTPNSGTPARRTPRRKPSTTRRRPACPGRARAARRPPRGQAARPVTRRRCAARSPRRRAGRGTGRGCRRSCRSCRRRGRASSSAPGTVTWLIGRCGSIHGKITNISSATTSKNKMNTSVTFNAEPPGRRRQIQTYIRPLRGVERLDRRGHRCAVPARSWYSTAWMIMRWVAVNLGWQVVIVISCSFGFGSSRVIGTASSTSLSPGSTISRPGMPSESRESMLLCSVPLTRVHEPLRLGLHDHRVAGLQVIEVQERLALADPVTGHARSCRPGPATPSPG